jgi:hypothetical protein
MASNSRISVNLPLKPVLAAAVLGLTFAAAPATVSDPSSPYLATTPRTTPTLHWAYLMDVRTGQVALLGNLRPDSTVVPPGDPASTYQVDVQTGTVTPLTPAVADRASASSTAPFVPAGPFAASRQRA